MKVIPTRRRGSPPDARRDRRCHSIRGELAEELQKTPGLTLKPVVLQAPNWIYFPSNGTRNRRGTICACGRPPISRSTARNEPGAVPRLLQDYRQHRPYTFDFSAAAGAVYDPAKAKKLMAEAGFANGFDAGMLYCDSSY
jgi:peptide/nickel transport system substrate-binding protein